MRKHYRDQDFINKVGNKIIEIRKEKKLTQEYLVEQTGFELKQIGRIERGETNTNISHIAKIAEALRVNPKDLLDF
ncbi:helix-turn-helix domain-containing protein [Pedobacter cryophilus]|uniref:Helix-turn-helix transcriptional regulator n=1 Tax=Pedobacter cryophilus TaxID=2571271 RepID=A0A4U1C2V3_9SPHI|nr:helix-turn-helix transcriptional regulator [Pedobacter cryophilus]TKB98636.1 helix-turn-helix transcriptional regulator [Pedobacter cryophilus]